MDEQPQHLDRALAGGGAADDEVGEPVDGREAWRIIRRRHPRLARFAAVYAVGLLVLAAWSVAQLL